ncbi:MAG: hypothetical protein NTW86_12845, partial [Candidatus Sumerlaeota bacterium]|nr:hypothetical protein [Candidatus Sumerlaeota bacterium]
MSYSRIAAPSRARFVFSVVVAILGVALIAVAAGLTAALTSAALAPPMAAGRPWPADLSRRASEGLIFLFGGAVAYATPVLAALLAAHCLVRKPSTWLRPVMRVLGATLLLGSLCALSTL